MLLSITICLENGGRYYQGNYLKECLPDFIETNVLKERLGNECHQFIQHEKKKLQKFII